jgi:hypothetical protein
MRPPAQLIGSNFDSALIEEHIFGDRRTLISIYFAHPDGAGLRFKVSPSGWGLAVSGKAPAPVDLGTAGVIVVRPVGAADGIPSGRIAHTWSVHAARSPEPVGVRLVTDAGDDVVVYAYDDVLLCAPLEGVELDDISLEATDD